MSSGFYFVGQTFHFMKGHEVFLHLPGQLPCIAFQVPEPDGRLAESMRIAVRPEVVERCPATRGSPDVAIVPVLPEVTLSVTPHVTPLSADLFRVISPPTAYG